MIDEKKLIEAIVNTPSECLDSYSVSSVQQGIQYGCATRQNEIIDIINEQPKTDWIPCTVVNHPEHCNDCEVTIKDTIGYFRDIAYYTDKWRRLADETPVNVIAWKEPSRPYKKEGAE